MSDIVGNPEDKFSCIAPETRDEVTLSFVYNLSLVS